MAFRLRRTVPGVKAILHQRLETATRPLRVLELPDHVEIIGRRHR